MLRRSPCHRGRVHFDFSEEVVKRLHTSTLRLELTPFFFCLLCLSVCLSGSHAFSLSLSLFACLFMWSLQLCIYLPSTTLILNMSQYLAILSAINCHKFLSLFFWTLVTQRSDVISYCVSFLLKHLCLQYHFLCIFSFTPLFSRLVFEFIGMICCCVCK